MAAPFPRGTAMAVAASAAVVILSTVLFPQMAVDGATVAAVDGDQLFEPKLIALDLDQGHMLDAELDPYLGQLQDDALGLKVIEQIRIRLFTGKGCLTRLPHYPNFNFLLKNLHHRIQFYFQSFFRGRTVASTHIAVLQVREAAVGASRARAAPRGSSDGSPTGGRFRRRLRSTATSTITSCSSGRSPA